MQRINPVNCIFYIILVCNLLREGVVSLFGPQNPDIGSHMQAICDRYDIPHIETSWDYRTRQDKYAINLFPHPDILGEVKPSKL